MSEEKKISFVGKLMYFLFVIVLISMGAFGYYFYDTYFDFSEDSYEFYIGEEFIKEGDRFACEYDIVSKENFELFWIDDDGSDIYNNTVAEIITINNCLEGSYDDFKGSLLEKIDNIMEKSGFVQNSENTESSDSTEECVYPVVRAYERDDIKCVVTEPFYSEADDLAFSCTYDYKENYNAQIQYIQDLNLDSIILMNISDDYDGFAMLNVIDRNSCYSHMILAKEIEGVWTKIYEGQEMASCELLEQNGFPTDHFFSGECVSEN